MLGPSFLIEDLFVSCLTRRDNRLRILLLLGDIQPNDSLIGIALRRYLAIGRLKGSGW